MRINVACSSMPPFEEYCAEIRDLWDTHWLTNNGEKALKLEAALMEVLDTPNVVLFSNGHLALEAAIRAMGLSGEAVTTPYTFALNTSLRTAFPSPIRGAWASSGKKTATWSGGTSTSTEGASSKKATSFPAS